VAIQLHFQKKHGKVTFQSGHFYVFRYQAWENDPEPNIIFINALSGIHEKTGREWRFIQGINLSYIPRKDRKRFVDDWLRHINSTRGNVKITWMLIKKNYPYISAAIRRYFYSPNYYIHDLRHVPFDKAHDVIVKSWSKDFSKRIRRSIVSRLFGRKKKK
jgi:hypothetical protein